jgi:acylphosphatase
VQGVGFRWWTRSLALQHQLRGSVKNLADGSVEVIAVGEDETLRRFGARLHDGPPGARVDRVEETEGELQGTSDSFEIVH